MTDSFRRVRNSYNKELRELARISKNYPFKLVVWRSYNDDDCVEGLRKYLNAQNIDYYFKTDSFHFKTEEDRNLAQWVK